MATSACRSCKKEVASSAKICPHCGIHNPAVTTKEVFIGSAVLLAAVAVGVVACTDSSEDNAAKPSDSTVTTNQVLRPEMLVQPVKDQFLAACRSEELLEQALTHSASGEKTKFRAMFSAYDCIQIPLGGTFKVLSVGRRVVEFTHATNSSSKGMWTVMEAMQPVK